ncbi:MAG: nucleotidyltransferase family protein [Methylococcaceae bacterium]|nr:nucleotidyltransferase family protein [Methylococcaceae bacterium]
MRDAPLPIIALLRNPGSAEKLSLSDWDLLVRQARRAGLLARLDVLLKNQGVAIPCQAANHFMSAQIYATQFAVSLHWEIRLIKQALNSVAVKPVFLKGCSYAIAKNRAALGRVFSDVDILVDREALAATEQALSAAGWMPAAELDDYDQKYYREWMHEIPPLQNYRRGTAVDVHHNILPLTSRHCPASKKLLEHSVEINGEWLLSDIDRVIHSAAHLFHEGEFDAGLRDLSDLDLLLKEFSIQPHFWRNLIQRANELKQTVPLYYALRYTRLILHTPVPDEVFAVEEARSCGKLKLKLMDALFLRGLMPDHESCNDRWTGLARWVLFVRSHWLKMPFYLLVVHLSRKAYKRVIGKDQH